MSALVEVLNQAWRAVARRLGWVLVHFRRQGTLLPGPSSRRTAALLVLTALVGGVAYSMPQAPESQPAPTTHPAPSASSGQATQPAPSVLAKPGQAGVERPAAESTKRTTPVLPSELFRRRVNPPWTAEEKARWKAMLEDEYLAAHREERYRFSGRNVPHFTEEEARKWTRQLAKMHAEGRAQFLVMDLGGPYTWGESANGLQARLYVKSTSQQPRASAVLVFHLRNTSDKPIRILKLSAQSRFWGECLPLEIRRAGAILKYQGPVLEPPSPPNESEYITLNPRDVDSIEVTFVPEHWKLAVPFEAQAVFMFKQTLSEDKTVGPYDPDKRQWRTVSGLWTGEASSQAVTVKMGTVAQTAGAKPARVTSDKAAARAAGLKKSGNSYFELRPVSIAGMKRLFLYPTDAKGSFPDTTEVARISPEQRRAIIDHLAVEGFLDNAASYDMAKPQYKGPTIILRAHWGKGFYDENLGWNPKMLDRLDGLRKLLDGDAGKAMDKYLAQLKAQRKERKPAASPATQPTSSHPITAKAEPEWLSRIREALPKGWSLKRDVRGPGENWTASRDEPIRVICHSPIAPMGPKPDERTLNITIIAGPKVSMAEHRRMVEFNAALEQKFKGNDGTLRLIAPWSWWEKRTETSKNRPYLLPTHFDDANSLRIHCRPLLIGSYEFKSKNHAAETANVLAAITSRFRSHAASTSRPAAILSVPPRRMPSSSAGQEGLD